MYARCSVAILCFFSSFVLGAEQSLSITNYQFVSSTPVTLTKANVTYRADLVNAGYPLASVTSTISSLNTASFTVVQGHETLTFAPVAANSRTTSSNTFTILVDRSVAFDFANVHWTFQTTPQPPVANAGPNQTVQAGATVTLNGTGSTNPSGSGTLIYNWALTQKPGGSNATISNATSVMPTFVADLPGNYTILLTVGNGTDSSSASVTVSTTHSAPVANAGPNQTVKLNATVTLNGSGSSSPDGRSLTYKWNLTAPSGSLATLSATNVISPSFLVDKFGTYTAQLIVNDGLSDSPASAVTISTSHTAPVANAGTNQSANVQATVQLDGSGSTDIDGNLLNYSWSLISAAPGSAAVLSNPNAVRPTFTVDRPGTYVAQLIVSDPYLTSSPATVTVTTNAVLPPTANAGANQTVARNAMVTLSGSGTDPQGLPLSYKWSLITKPSGSNSALSVPAAQTLSLATDSPGQYVAQLVLNNGFVDSAPSTVTITTTNSAPVANPGQPQNIRQGDTVTLDGSGSSDSDNDKLTYSWSFLSVPINSAATLNGATSASPMFVADRPGTYIVQLIVNDGYANSAPKTVSATTGILLTPNPLNLTTAGPAGTLTVTLPSPAGQNGETINLTTDPSLVLMPTSITVPTGASMATVTVTPLKAGSASILASSQTFATGSATVSVNQSAITLSPSPGQSAIIAAPTQQATGVITLSENAAADLNITIQSSDTNYVTVVTPKIVIPAGTNTGTFKVLGVAVTSGVTITASATGYSSGTISVTVAFLGKIFLPAPEPGPFTVAPGQSVSYPVTLATGAPADTTITLTSDSANATISPGTVIVHQGKVSPDTQPTLTGVALGPANISASAPGFIGDTQAVQVRAALSFTPQTLTLFGNETKNLALALSATLNQDLQVNLSSSDPTVASVAGPVTIPKGAISISVPVTGGGTKNGLATITAAPTNTFVDGATAKISNVPLGQIMVPSNPTIALGQAPATFAITLPAPAPAAVTITLNSSDPSTVALSATTVQIGAGATAPDVQPQITGLSPGSAVISVSAGGYSPNSASVNVTASLSFPNTVPTIGGGQIQNVTLSLSAITAKAVTINLSSDNTALATVPQSVSIPAGGSTVQVPITGVVGTGGTTTIHALAGVSNVTPANITVTITQSAAIILQSGVTVGPNQSAQLAVSLSAAPASNVTVNLSSANPSIATVSQSVTINAGTTGPVSATVNGVNFGAATINATASGYAPTSQQVLVGAALSFPASAVNAVLGSVQNITLTLSAPAPANGLSVNLTSSDQTVAAVSGPLSFQANNTTLIVPVSALKLGTAKITASSNAPNVTPASIDVNVVPGGSLNIPSSPITVGPTQSASFPISLSAAAPANGVSVALTSSNPSIATINSPVFIIGGATAPAAQPTVTGVNFGTTTMSASAPGFASVPANTTVNVGAALSLPVNTSITVGAVQNVTLGLSAPAPAALVITLASGNTAIANAPPSVTIPAGSSSVLVPVTGVATGSTTITASSSIPTVSGATANVSVVSGIILPSNIVALPGFNSVPFPVSLSAPAPYLVFITLTSSDPSKVALAANGAASTTFSIQPGQTVPTVSTKVFGVDFGSATITATSPDYTPVSTVVKVSASVVFVPNPVNITPGGNKLVTLVMGVPAPTGLTVNLKVDNPNVATVPSSLTFPVNTTGACQEVGGNTCQIVFSVNAGSIQDSTLLHASAPPFIPDTTATIIVGTPGPPVITSTSLPDGQVGTAYSSTLTGDQGIVPYTWSVVGGVLPAGLTLDPLTGLIGGTPTVPAEADLTFQITDSATPAQIGTKTLHLSIRYQGALFITTSSLSNAILNSPYSATLTAAGGTKPYTWSLVGGTLPNGLSLNPSTGVISGTPTTLVSNVQLTFKVIDSSSPIQTAQKTLSLSVVPAELTITTNPPLPDGIVGQPYSTFLHAAGGALPYTWSIIVGKLPGFYHLDPNTGEIYSDPSGAICVCDGNFQMTFQVADSAGHTATKILWLNMVDGSLVLVTPSVPGGQVGLPYSYSFQAKYGKPPYSWTLGGLLPNGLTFNPSTGTISGTPTAATPTLGVRLKITVTDSAGAQEYAFFSLVIISGPPAITTASLPGGIVGKPYSATVVAGGGIPPIAFTATGLPAGLAINSATGIISGTPATAGPNTNVGVTVCDSSSPAQCASRTYSIPIAALLNVSLPVIPSCAVGAQCTFTVPVTGGTTPYSFTVTGLPAGLTINSSTGVISGIPTTAGNSTNIVVNVSDSSSPVQSGSITFSMTITIGLSIATASPLPDGTVNNPYNVALQAVNGTTPYSWSATGLPAGLAINAQTGVISGTPTTPVSNATVAVTVNHSATPAHTVTKTFALAINGPVIITPSLPAGGQNVSYNVTVTATGGTTPYSWSATGLPAGLAIGPQTGVISGTPTQSGTSTVQVRVTDSAKPIASTFTATFTLTIGPQQLAIITTSLPAGTQNVAYTATVQASGGTPQYTWSAGGLPANLTINPSTGVISGIPTTTFDNTVTFTVKDSTNAQVSLGLRLTINAPLQITTPSPLPAGTKNTAYLVQLTAAGGQSPYTWSAANLPAGLSITASGQITGVATAAGTTNNISVTVTDSTAPVNTTTRTFTLTIADPLVITTTSPLPNGFQNMPYAATLTASGGTPSYTWSATGLPTGLAISNGGVISGNPVATGTSIATITVKDAMNNIVSGQFSITILPQQFPVYFNNPVTNAISLGQSLQGPVTISVTTAPLVDLRLTLTSNNPAVAAFVPSGGAQSPQPQIMVTVPANQTSIVVNVIGLAIGTTTISASGGNYGGTGNVTVTPSGFSLTGPNGIGPSSFNLNQGQVANLSVSAVQLDNSGNILATNQSVAWGSTVTVLLDNSNSSCGTLPASLTFTAGDSSLPALFKAAASASPSACSTVLKALPPSGFSTPVSKGGNANTLTANVSGFSCTIPDITVGRGLMASSNVSLAGLTGAPLQITVQSSDSSKVLLACAVSAPNCTGTDPGGTGASMITVTVPSGGGRSPNFYVYGAGAPGTANYSVGCGAGLSDQKTVTVTQSGFMIAGPGGPGAPVNVGIGAASSAGLTISSVALDSTLAPARDSLGNILTQDLVPGLSGNPAVSIDVQPSNVGSVSPTSVSFGSGPGSGTATTVFTGATSGTATVTANAPNGFSTPTATYSKVTVNVSPATWSVCGAPVHNVPQPVLVGYHLQLACQAIVSPAPTTDLIVTLSTGSTQLLISNNPAQAGQSSTTVTIPAGQTSSNPYYLQALSNTGSATYTATVSGFSPLEGTATMTQSGIYLSGPLDQFGSFTTTLSGGPVTLNGYLYQIDPSGSSGQDLAGGLTLTLSLASDATVGNVSSPTITGGSGSRVVHPVFTPVNTGQTTISLTTPSGFSPTSYQSLNVTVTPP